MTAGPSPSFFPDDLMEQAAAVLATLKARGLMLATAESCTGGLIGAALTAVAGSSAAYDRGFVTYSNEAKTQMLGVPEDMLAHHGAVSPEVARAMAEGALNASQAGVAVAVTGIAGPEGGSPDKPVGLVYLACALAPPAGQTSPGAETAIRRQVFAGTRHDVRHATVHAALDLVRRGLDSTDPAAG